MSLDYQVRGNGEPLVLISGLGGLAAFWDKTAEYLATHYKVITFDHPGMGKSSLEGKPTISGIVDAVISILDELDIQSAHILGHSTGGIVTQNLALDHPDRVRKIILSSTWAKPDKRFKDFFDLRQVILEKSGTEAYSTFTKLIGYTPAWYAEHLAPTELIDFTKENQSIDAVMIKDRIDMLLNNNRIDELGSLNNPALIIGSLDDQIVPYYHSFELNSLIKNSKVIDVTGGHFVPNVYPSKYADIVKEFIGSNHEKNN